MHDTRAENTNPKEQGGTSAPTFTDSSGCQDITVEAPDWLPKNEGKRDNEAGEEK